MILELPCRCEAANTLPMYVSAKFPERIVCLTEETTETLYLLGEERRIVGISGFTVRPARARREKPKVSAFTSANIERIVELKPDLVLGFSDLQADIAATLIRAGIEVHVFNHRSVREILRMIGVLGGMIGCEGKAAALINELNVGLAAVSAPPCAARECTSRSGTHRRSVRLPGCPNSSAWPAAKTALPSLPANRSAKIASLPIRRKCRGGRRTLFWAPGAATNSARSVWPRDQAGRKFRPCAMATSARSSPRSSCSPAPPHSRWACARCRTPSRNGRQ